MAEQGGLDPNGAAATGVWARDRTEDPARRLMAWSTGSFHTVLLTLVLVLFSYRADQLALQLGEIGSLVGAGIFVVLWTLGLWTAGRAQLGFNLAPRRPANSYHLIAAGFLWGGVNGTLFLWVLLATFAGSNLLSAWQGQGLFDLARGLADPSSLPPGLLSGLWSALLGLLLFGMIGGFVAYVIGGVIGWGFALIDRGCWAFASRLADGTIAEDRPAEEGPDGRGGSRRSHRAGAPITLPRRDSP